MKNYKQRLQKLQERRTDVDLKKVILSDSFSKSDFGETTRYVLESMLPVDPEYNAKTIKAAENIQSYITVDLTENCTINFHYQGSVTTNTNIKLYSDIDLVAVTRALETMESPYTVTYPITEVEAIRKLRVFRNNVNVKLAKQFSYITDKSKAISIRLTAYRRDVDVVIANYFFTKEHYYSKKDEDLGLYIYNKVKDVRESDHTFKNIGEVNAKGSSTGDASKKLIRFCKTLKEDDETSKIDLTSFELTSIVHGIDNGELILPSIQQHLLLNKLSTQLSKLINNTQYRENLKSPNGKELIFGTNTQKVNEIRKLHLELEEIISDMAAELRTSTRYLSEGLPYYRTR